jgi:hypothetical protein
MGASAEFENLWKNKHKRWQIPSPIFLRNDFDILTAARLSALLLGHASVALLNPPQPKTCFKNQMSD